MPWISPNRFFKRLLCYFNSNYRLKHLIPSSACFFSLQIAPVCKSLLAHANAGACVCVWGLGGVQHNCWRPKAQLAPHSSTRARTPQAKHFATLLAVYTTAGWFSMDSICAVTKEVAASDWPSLRSAHWPRVIDLALCRKCVLQRHTVCAMQCEGWYSSDHFRFFLWQLSCNVIECPPGWVSWKLAKT